MTWNKSKKQILNRAPILNGIALLMLCCMWGCMATQSEQEEAQPQVFGAHYLDDGGSGGKGQIDTLELDSQVISGATVSVETSGMLTKSEAVRFIEKTLLLNGYAFVPSGDSTVKLISFGSGKQPRRDKLFPPAIAGCWQLAGTRVG